MTTRTGLLILAVLLLSIAGGALLSGCASTFDGLCVARALGQDENGNTAIRVYCEAN